MNDKSIPSYTIESLKAMDVEVKEFDLFRFEYFARDIEHLKAPHRHHFYTFILVTGGSGSHSIDFKKYDLREKRLFLIAPDQVHSWIELKKVEGFVLMFNDTFMAMSKGRKLITQWPLFRLQHSCYLDISPTEERKWIDEFISIEEELTRKDEFIRDAVFYAISYLLVRASRLYNAKKGSKITSRSNFIFTFQELIEKHLTTLKTPKEYAALMNITSNYLNGLCNKISGKTAGELIRQRILLEAKRYLAHTQLSVAEIAFKLGFEDNSYFGRFFKKYSGKTPVEFRGLQRGNGSSLR